MVWGPPGLAGDHRPDREARPARGSLRVLDRRDLDAALDLCARDLVGNLFVAARLGQRTAERRHGGEVWGWYEGSDLVSLCWAGGNMVPVEATPNAVEAFAARARRSGRTCSSLVGPAAEVLALWARLEPAWGRCREVRSDQPLMALAGPPAVAPDPAVRRSRMHELDVLLPACVAMFTEEVGYSPMLSDGGAGYQAQVNGLVATGRSFVRVDSRPDGPQVVFKAELGTVTPQAVQVQGVWVAPPYRGQGLAAAGMAALVQQVQAEVAPVVTLYVNNYNERALRAYRRVGFHQVGTYATVLF